MVKLQRALDGSTLERMNLRCAVALVLISLILRIAWNGIDPLGVMCGAVFSVVNLKFYRVAVELFLVGPMPSSRFFMVLLLKLPLVGAIIIVLSQHSEQLLFSALLGMFSVVPAALLLAVQRREI